MATNDSSGNWLWFIVLRSGLYAIFGALVGAICGALCIGLAGFAIGLFIDKTDKFPSTGNELSVIGGMIGLIYGAVTGGVIGLLSWGTIGVVAPPSRILVFPKNVAFSMITSMAIGSSMATVCYFVWCALLGALRGGFNGFIALVPDNLSFALFGVPALMGIGQIFGVWRASSRRGKRGSHPA